MPALSMGLYLSSTHECLAAAGKNVHLHVRSGACKIRCCDSAAFQQIASLIALQSISLLVPISGQVLISHLSKAFPIVIVTLFSC